MWLRADNAYYRGSLIAYCRAKGWDYSVSVTDPRRRAPVLDGVDDLADPAWTAIGFDEEATVMRHRPAGWEAEQSYVVVRRVREDGQGQLSRPTR